MNQKIQLQEIADALSASKGLSKKDATNFARLLFEIVSDAIDKDKYVKIKGLGTFKQVEVDNRESINVNTGERILIQGHTKISFTPDTSLRDIINKPFAHFETVAINEDVVDSDLEVIDSMDVLANEPIKVEAINEKPTKEEYSKESETDKSVEQTNQPIASEQPTASVQPLETEKEFFLKDEPNETLSPKESIIKQQIIEKQIIGEQIIEKQTTTESSEKIAHDLTATQSIQENDTVKESSHPHKKNRWRLFFITLGIVFLALLSYFVGYYQYLCPDCQSTIFVHDTVYITKHKVIVKKTSKLAKDTLQSNNQTEAIIGKKEKAIQTKEATEKSSSKDQHNEKEINAYPQVNGGAYWIVGTMQTYKIGDGETIRLIAERFFGSRQMALYIVKYNDINDPDHVSSGTVLKIPKLVLKKK